GQDSKRRLANIEIAFLARQQRSHSSRTVNIQNVNAEIANAALNNSGARSSILNFVLFLLRSENLLVIRKTVVYRPVLRYIYSSQHCACVFSPVLRRGLSA